MLCELDSSTSTQSMGRVSWTLRRWLELIITPLETFSSHIELRGGLIKNASCIPRETTWEGSSKGAERRARRAGSLDRLLAWKLANKRNLNWRKSHPEMMLGQRNNRCNLPRSPSLIHLPRRIIPQGRSLALGLSWNLQASSWMVES